MVWAPFTLPLPDQVTVSADFFQVSSVINKTLQFWWCRAQGCIVINIFMVLSVYNFMVFMACLLEVTFGSIFVVVSQQVVLWLLRWSSLIHSYGPLPT